MDQPGGHWTGVELEQETGMDQTGGRWTVMELEKKQEWTILVAVKQAWN